MSTPSHRSTVLAAMLAIADPAITASADCDGRLPALMLDVARYRAAYAARVPT